MPGRTGYHLARYGGGRRRTVALYHKWLQQDEAHRATFAAETRNWLRRLGLTESRDLHEALYKKGLVKKSRGNTTFLLGRYSGETGIWEFSKKLELQQVAAVLSIVGVVPQREGHGEAVTWRLVSRAYSELLVAAIDRMETDVKVRKRFGAYLQRRVFTEIGAQAVFAEALARDGLMGPGHRTTLSQRIRGESVFTLPEMKRLARLAEVTPDTLWRKFTRRGKR